jgi:hypothetical protein
MASIHGEFRFGLFNEVMQEQVAEVELFPVADVPFLCQLIESFERFHSTGFR